MAAPEVTLYTLLMLLQRRGGSIVSTASLTPHEIAVARADFRLFVDKDGCGYVYKHKEKPP